MLRIEQNNCLHPDFRTSESIDYLRAWYTAYIICIIYDIVLSWIPFWNLLVADRWSCNYVSCIICIMHHIHYASYALCIIFIMHHIHYASYSLCIICMICIMHHTIQYALYASCIAAYRAAIAIAAKKSDTVIFARQKQLQWIWVRKSPNSAKIWGILQENDQFSLKNSKNTGAHSKINCEGSKMERKNTPTGWLLKKAVFWTSL